MSIEVQGNRYRFQRSEQLPAFASAFLKAHSKSHGGHASATGEQLQFVHNYLHDVEGLWWIAAWVLFYTHPISRALDTSDLERAKRQLRQAELIFPDTLRGSDDRASFLMSGPDYGTATTCLPEEFADLKALVAIEQNRLMEFYKSMEYPLTNVLKKELYGRVYDELSPIFQDAAEFAQGEVIFLSDAIKQMQGEAKAGPDATMEATGEKDQLMDSSEEIEGQVEVPVTKGTKRAREDQPEESVSTKKRRTLNAGSPSSRPQNSKQKPLQRTLSGGRFVVPSTRAGPSTRASTSTRIGPATRASTSARVTRANSSTRPGLVTRASTSARPGPSIRAATSAPTGASTSADTSAQESSAGGSARPKRPSRK